MWAWAIIGALVLTATGPSLAAPKPADACVCQVVCGAIDEPCCSCTLRPSDEKCAVFGGASAWCLKGSCGEQGKCEASAVVDSSARGCGSADEDCCERGYCEIIPLSMRQD